MYKSFSLATDGVVFNSEKAVSGEAKPLFEASNKNKDDKVYRFIGTTEAIDRDNEIVRLDAWDFTNFVKNPVALWGHNHKDLPIGKVVGIYKDDVKKAIYFDIQFSKSYDFAKTVESLVEEGILRATSVGFMVKDWEWDEKTETVVFTETELFEISIVNVPANHEAILEELETTPQAQKSKDADVDQLVGDIADIRSTLETLVQELASLKKPESNEPENKDDEEDTTVVEPETKPDEKPTNEPINVELLAEQIAQAISDKLSNADKDDSEEDSPSESESDKTDEGESEDEELTVDGEPEQPEDEGEASDEEEELVVVSVHDLDETSGFIIINEEEN